MNLIENRPDFMEHYLKGGIFLATYDPKVVHDLIGKNYTKIGDRIEVYQNILIAPNTTKYPGQHMFSSRSISGYFPEQDIKDLEIIPNEFIEFPERLPVYMYRMYFLTQEQLDKNFGKTHGLHPPFISSREYAYPSDDRVLRLANPPASYCEKAIWNGEKSTQIKWTVLYGDNCESK